MQLGLETTPPPGTSSRVAGAMGGSEVAEAVASTERERNQVVCGHWVVRPRWLSADPADGGGGDEGSSVAVVLAVVASGARAWTDELVLGAAGAVSGGLAALEAGAPDHAALPPSVAATTTSSSCGCLSRFACWRPVRHPSASCGGPRSAGVLHPLCRVEVRPGGGGGRSPAAPSIGATTISRRRSASQCAERRLQRSGVRRRSGSRRGRLAASSAGSSRG